MPIVLRRPIIQCRNLDSNSCQRQPDNLKDEECCGFNLPT